MERWGDGDVINQAPTGDAFTPTNGVCRLLVGMQDTARDEVRKVFSLRGEELMIRARWRDSR